MTNKINHYNQFLIHLDQQQKKEKVNNSEKDKDKNENFGKEEIEDLLKEIMNQYENNYDTKIFTGYDKEDMIEDDKNPNFYHDSSINILNDIKDIKKIFKKYILFENQNKKENPSFYTLKTNIPTLSLPNKLKSSIQNRQKTPPLNTDEIDKDLKLDINSLKKEKHSRKEEEPSLPLQKKVISLEREIHTLEDLLEFIEKNPLEKNVEYNIQLRNLHNIREYLIELNQIIGMQYLKSNIVNQILYFIQEFYKSPSCSSSPGKEKEKTLRNYTEIKNQDFLHTVITGPPGTGKTEVAKIMGKMYGKMGILSKGTFKKVTRSDLIAGYLGQTAIKTKDVILESLGGVLFIDEAYALGNSEKRDSFSKECIDTLCEALSDHKDNWMVIIAGYEEELNDCFFSYNQGLESRFNWRFKTEEYGAEELYLIFLKKVRDIGWNILDDSTQDSLNKNKKQIDVKWFEKNKDYFKFYGRDIETLLSKIKMVHSKRVFGREEREKRKISYEDLEKGLEMFLKNTDQKKREEEKERNRLWESIYV